MSLNVPDLVDVTREVLPVLRLARQWHDLLSAASERLAGMVEGGGGSGYVAVHARVEEEWKGACRNKRWQCRCAWDTPRQAVAAQVDLAWCAPTP